MKKGIGKYIVWGIIILGILALVVNKVYSIQKKKKQTTVNKSSGPPPVVVNAYVVKPQKIENAILSTGSAIANEMVSLQPEVSGRVIKINFKEGRIVSKGSLMIKLFDADLQAQLKKLKLQEELAIKNEQRLKGLLDINAVSQQEYDLALNQLQTIQADMDLVKANIQKTEIRAPFTGLAGFRNISEGAFVSPTTIITTVQQLQPMRIDFSVPEKYLQLVNNKESIEFTIDGSDDVLTAPVYAVDPAIDPSTRSVKIRALFANKKAQLLPGAFIKIMMPLQTLDNGIMVPTEAVIPELKGQKVYISKNGKAFSQKIELGIRTDSTVQVTSGLQAGDTVLTTGIMQLRQDSPLKIMQTK